MKIYPDTNIYIDYWDNRTDARLPLGEFAHILFKRTISCEFTIVYSNLIVNEIGRHCSLSPRDVFKFFFKEFDGQGKLEFVHGYSRDAAGQLSQRYNIPLPDAIHILLAEKSNALIVSRDRHFLSIETLRVCRPEDL